MVEKNSHNRKQLWEDGTKLESRILKRMDMIEEKIIPWSLNVENDDEKHHQDYLDTPEEPKRRGWANDENNLEDLGEDIWLMINHSYVKLQKEFRIAPGKIRRVR